MRELKGPEQLDRTRSSEATGINDHYSNHDYSNCNPSVQPKRRPKVLEAGNFLLHIPSLGLENVIVLKGTSEDKMMDGCGLEERSGLPFEDNSNVFIAGHRMGYHDTESEHVFLGLPDIKYGEKIILEDHFGTTYTYVVNDKIVVKPTGTWVLNEVKNTDIISLRTCLEDLNDWETYGPNWKARLIVRGVKVDEQPLASKKVIGEINSKLNNMAVPILKAQQKVGIDLPIACTVVQKESEGFNIFGCNFYSEFVEPQRAQLEEQYGKEDWWKYISDELPYCWHDVTRERIDNLLNSEYYSRVDLGITQLAYGAFIDEAEELGGVDIPYYQCLVSFNILKRALEKHGWDDRVLAFATYNGGPSPSEEVIQKYGHDFETKRLEWEESLKEG